MSNDKDNGSLDQFLRRLLVAPKARQTEAIESALALLDHTCKPPTDQIFYNGREAAKQLNISYQTLWRLRRSGAIRAVHIPGLNRPRYSRKSLERLAGGTGGAS